MTQTIDADLSLSTDAPPDPSAIMQIGLGFWPSKALPARRSRQRRDRLQVALAVSGTSARSRSPTPAAVPVARRGS
jgi:hypothetical protein